MHYNRGPQSSPSRLFESGMLGNISNRSYFSNFFRGSVSSDIEQICFRALPTWGWPGDFPSLWSEYLNYIKSYTSIDILLYEFDDVS